ncbi:hypothetical protein PIB30_064304 [Stylosanthes scabra]|uniref:Uncharacterized protein n=1 Tax=Stylosanthes scabra TaxID=79078 RepID=A0ABU6ZKF2_9FABA|nr:hypothetical protein [Stylosanthes scabra]
MSANVDDISSVNEYGANEPPFEQLVTDSDEEYDVNKDLYAESYLDDEEWDGNDYTSEKESDVEVKDKETVRKPSLNGHDKLGFGIFAEIFGLSEFFRV